MEIPPTPQEIARNAFCSTVALEVELANGGRHTIGSGFFIGKDLIVTNLHVIHGILGNCYAKLVNQTNEYLIEGYTHIDVERDLVILKVSGVGTTILPWGNSDNVQVGDTVYAVGNPRGLQGTFSEGIISSIRSDATGKVLQMTAPISPGSSGGPVLNNSGKVVGISVSFIRDGQNLNFAIPLNPLRALLTKSANLKLLFQAKFEGVSWIRNPLGWNGTATYTFSLQNKHRWPIKNVHCLVLFSDQLQRHIGFDIVKSLDPIPAGATKNITRRSIFDIPQLQNLDFNGWNVADRIAFLILSTIRLGQNLSDYNIVDPVAKNSAGSYEVRVIDYELLT